MRNKKLTRGRPPPNYLPPDPSRQAPCRPEDYEHLEFIGHGSYGTVTQARKVVSNGSVNGNYFAVKTHKSINSYVGDQIKYRFINELLMLSSGALLKKVDSQFIIRLKDWYIDSVDKHGIG